MTDGMTLRRELDEVLTLEGGSEDDVRAAASRQWNLPESDLVVKVIDEEKSFFGLFGRKLRAEVRPIHPAPMRRAQARLTEMFRLMDFDLQAVPAGDDRINISGYDAKRLIGHHGEGLKVLDYLSNLMARSQGGAERIRVDCDGYRHQREKDLERIAIDAAQEAMKSKRTVYLEPMSSWERRLVHLALSESLNVETHSVGVEPHRKVAIRLVGTVRRSRNDGGSAGEGARERCGRIRSDRQSR